MNAQTETELLQRIVLNPEIMAGKPIIQGTRLTVQFILSLLAHGTTFTEITDEYTSLTENDINACLLFAAKSLESMAFLPLSVEAA